MLYLNGNAVDEYPTNKFTEQSKGFDSDTFFKGRDGRTWMLDPEGFHIVYCCINAHDNDYGIGIHWANEIELSLPVSRVNTAESEMTRDIAQAKAIEGKNFNIFLNLKLSKLILTLKLNPNLQ